MQPDHQQASSTYASCVVCGALPSRRDFLRDAASLAACAAVFGTSPQLTVALRLLGGEAVYPIPQQDGATIDRGREVILVRYQNRIYAFGLSCPHQRTLLRWQNEDRRFQCPKHKSTFQLDGTFLAGRATRSLDRYGLRREGDTVVVALATLLKEDTDRDRWVEAVVQL